MTHAGPFRPGLPRAVLVRLVGGIAMVLTVALAASPTVAQQQPAGKASYDKLCLACHGATGAGDGPAAAALPTKPKDLADSTVAAMTDEDMVKLLSEGKPPMPAFGKQLSESQVMALVAYVRELGESRRRHR